MDKRRAGPHPTRLSCPPLVRCLHSPHALDYIHRMNAFAVKVSDAWDATVCARTRRPATPPDSPDKLVATVAVPASSTTTRPWDAKALPVLGDRSNPATKVLVLVA